MSTEESAPVPGEDRIPVLREVLGAGPEALLPPERVRALAPDARAALRAEARYLLEELLDECLPLLEARLRERLEERLRALEAAQD